MSLCYFRIIFLFEWDFLVSVDSSTVSVDRLVTQDASQTPTLLLFRPGRQCSRWHFSSLNCMKRLPIHGWDMTLERRLPCTASHRHLKERRACSWIHPNLLDTAGHRLPEEWETSRLWPRQIRALDSTCILFLTGIYIPQDMPLLCKVMLCYLSWARVSLYVTMAVTASDRDPEILGPKPAQPDLCFLFQH